MISGNLTRDPETKQLSGDNSVTKLRIANNTRKKVDGEWVDVAGYYDATIWGKHGETVAKYLSKGSGIIVIGRLEWREWEATDGTKRQGVEIIVSESQFTGGKGETSDTSSGGSAAPARQAALLEDDPDIPFHHIDQDMVA